jgi:hypothetical protein
MTSAKIATWLILHWQDRKGDYIAALTAAIVGLLAAVFVSGILISYLA